MNLLPRPKKLGDRLSYSAQRTVHLASLQVGENIGQKVALKMMQKQLITQSGGFPYLQMEKEVYHSSLDLRQKRGRLETRN